MARLEREIMAYQLVTGQDPDDFSESVNCHIDDGFQPLRNGMELVTVHGESYMSLEMVKYVPEQMEVNPFGLQNLRTTQVNTIGGATGTIPTLPTGLARVRDTRDDEATERMEDTVQGEPVRERPFWTADSPDPFDDDEEFNDDEVNDHQLRRMGMMETEVDEDRPQMVEATTRAFTDAREATMDARAMGNTAMMDGGMAEAGQAMEATQEDHPF